MDIVTQALLGAALAQTVATKEETKLATMIGLVAGVLADADIFIYSSADPLLTLDFHRHFTHSIFFIPIGALIVAGLLKLILKDRIGFKRLYVFSLLGYSLSGFIDACTSYGTHLFWPVYNERISFNIISIIDPIFTIGLLVSILMVWFKVQPKYAKWGLGYCALYLSLGLFQHQRAVESAEQLITERGHVGEKVLVKPSFANILVWRKMYIADNRIYVDAVRLGLSAKIYEGGSVALFNARRDMPTIEVSSVLNKDIERFKKFSAGYVAISAKHNNVLGDIRYSMLPNMTAPIWGITINQSKQEEHASYGFYRENSKVLRGKFLDMLIGRPLQEGN